MDLKERRKKLGLSRAQLGAYSYVDPRTLQLIELEGTGDADCIDRLDKTLEALENGQEPPPWKEQVDADIAAEGSAMVADGQDARDMN